MNLIIDNREQARIDLAKEYYTDKIENITVEQLSSADYVFKENDVTVAYEYKTSMDFIASMLSHRVFDEVVRMIQDYDYSYVIIEGNIEYALNRYTYLVHKYISNEQLKGAYRRIRTMCPVIIVENHKETNKNKIDKHLPECCFEEMLKQTKKCVDGKSLYYTKIKKKKSTNPVMNLLLDLHNINYETAKKIVKTLKLKTQADYFNLTHDDLIKVKGIGDKKAKHILKNRGKYHE